MLASRATASGALGNWTMAKPEGHCHRITRPTGSRLSDLNRGLVASRGISCAQPSCCASWSDYARPCESRCCSLFAGWRAVGSLYGAGDSPDHLLTAVRFLYLQGEYAKRKVAALPPEPRKSSPATSMDLCFSSCSKPCCS